MLQAVFFYLGMPIHAVTLSTAEGHVNFYKHTGSSDDAYTTNPTAATIQFMNQHWMRLKSYATYWDQFNKLSWYSNAWDYEDSYAIYSDPNNSTYAPLVQQHPDWILHDIDGNPLYIAYGPSCNTDPTRPHTCTQYAANITDPNGFRAWWINNVRGDFTQNPPFKGLWIDDVNLDITHISNGDGKPVTPMDPNTGAPMTPQAWETYFADFMAQVRAAFPSVEIVHNSIWFVNQCAPPDAQIQREIQAADWINAERGVNDSGIVGGTGCYSYQAFLSFVDSVHSQGKGIVFDTDIDLDSDVAREYSVASWLLISNGKDLVGDNTQTPTHWWPGFDTNFGAARGPRITWNGLLRRDFNGGIALVNQPGSNSTTVTLPGTFQRVDGSMVTSITLNAGEGAVLSTVGPGPTWPVITQPPQNQTVVPGQSVTFTLAATGTPAPTYQWQFVSLTGQTTVIAGATSNSYMIPAVSLAMNGMMYQCVVSNNIGSVTSQSAVLTVNTAGANTALLSNPFNVNVHPNPWRSDKHAGKNMIFDGLTVGTSLKIFTMSGHKVKEIHTDGPSVSWNLTNDSGDKVGSGIYIYVLTDQQGDKTRGKIAIIK